jgi:hypothetical protein
VIAILEMQSEEPVTPSVESPTVTVAPVTAPATVKTTPVTVAPTSATSATVVKVPTAAATTATGTTATEDIQTGQQDHHVAVSDIRQEVNPPLNIPVSDDSMDENRQLQPMITNQPEIVPDEIARLEPETSVKKNEEPVTVAVVAPVAPVLPVYDDIVFVDNTSAKSQLRNRWEIMGQFAPLYSSYRSIASVPTGVQKSDFNDAESPLRAYSGGIAVSYKLFDRLSVQTGVYYAQTGQSINNVTPVTSMYIPVSSNNSYPKNFVRTSSGSVTVASNLKSDTNSSYDTYFNAESTTAPIANVSHPVKYRLIERVDYFEIPLLLRYRIIDRKLNFYVLGGMSANVLIDTNVFVDNGSEIVKGGNILMARPMNYSGTFGLGLGFQMMKNLSLGLEPSFKYFLHPYTTSSQIDSNPYAFGMFTGMSYRF